MDFNNLFQVLKNKEKKVRIVFPEGDNEFVRVAAQKLVENDLAQPILVVKNDSDIKENSLTYVSIESTNLDEYAAELFDLRKAKGLTLENAYNLVNQPNYFATMLLHKDLADCYVGGITYSTADSIRPGLQIIKTKPGFSKISSTMILNKGDKDLFFSDIAVNIDPSSEDLADFTIQLANLIKSFGKTPNVAMLSFSTKGSAKHPLVDKVVNAGHILDEKNVDFSYDYELQFDAAFDSVIRSKKAPNSNLQGEVNGYMFPNLDSANIGYKIAQRLGDYDAIGPIITGFNKVINDLSRGANSDEIFKLAVVSAIQSIEKK